MFGRRKPKRDPELDQYTVEPMEPRVLLSADALGVDAGVLDHDSSDQADWDLKDAEDWSRSLASHDTADTAPLAPAGDDTDSRVEIVFLDAGVEDGQQLLADLLSRDGSAITQVHLLDSNSDGVAQIAQVLAGQQDIDAIHIISHGAAGQVQLGSGTLSTGSLDGYTGQLNDWGSALADSGDILIYGCDLAADTQGRALVNAIGILTGADVAASVDQTGHAAQGGDWELEYRAGEVETQTFTMVDLPVWQGTLAAFIVDTAADTVDANPGDGVAEDAAGNTSLRAAIMEANMLAGADTIFLGADNYKISIIGTGDGSGDFDIRSDLSIVGLSPTQTTVDADDLDRVFEVHDDAAYTVSISNLEIVKGLSPASVNGAGLLVQGATNTPDVYLDNVRFKNNDASGAGAMGGAIANSGNLTITNSLIDGNSAPEGGGIWNGPTGVLYMENVTISGNTATVGDGGGLFNEGDATLRHATVTNNTAAGAGGGVIHDNGAVSTDIGNSIIAGNNASTSPDITNTVGIITSAGGNIIQDASGTGTDFAPSERGIDPLLGALADNGGDLMTHAPGAPAIDAADPALSPNTDQRGFLRGDGAPDIGAYEAGATAATTAHYLDEFNAAGSYAGNDGTLLWANEWQEIGEPTDPDFGNVSLWNLLSEDGLYMRWANNMGAWRQADLSGATAAVLSFDWAMTKAGAGVQASIQISTDGVVWTTLDTFNGPLDHSSMQSASYDISAYIDSDTRIRFETLSGFGSNEVFFVDDVRIGISTPAPSTTSLSAVKDTYLWSANPADNFGVDTTLKMDESGAGLGNGHTLLQFDLSTLPAGATITSAVLQMEATGKTGTGADSSVINIYEVTEAWDEGSGGSNNDATWDERQTGAAWGSLGGTVDSTAVASLTTSATGAHTWDITDLVEDWQTGAKTNNGLMLASDDTGTVIFNYDSREGGTPPQLVISYTVPPVDNDPVFQNAGPYNIDEGAAVSTIVGDVDADDGDGGAVDVGITYAITANLDPDGDSNKAFAIDPNTGVITVNDADDLDYEAASSMVITVEADDGVNTETTDVTINIDDVAPTLSVSGAATIKEGEVYTLNLSAAEPGTDDISSWTIDWGDGTTETIAGNPSTATHTYTNAGFTNNILVSATDSGGVTHRVGELISTSLQNDSIYWFDASTGAVNHVENLPGPGNSPVDVQVGPDGEIYVTGFASDKIFRYNADGSFDTTFADAGDGLNNPSRIAFGPDGNLYVTNMSTNEVLRFSGVDGVSSGTAMGAFISSGLNQPDAITFGPDGKLYVGNVGTGDVLRFDGVTGALDPTFTANGSSGGYMDIQFGPDGRLWMTNQSSDDIRRYSATDGSFYDIFADTGATDFAGIAFGGDGYVYMSDAMAEDKIIRYPVGDGSAPEPFVLSGTGGLDQPVDITFTPAHQVTVNPNQAPTFTSFVGPVASGDEDSEITVTFGDLEAQGDEADTDGAVDAFVVKSVTSGTLKIGASAATATAWAAGSNDTLDATTNAYWTPDTDDNGTLDAFEVVAEDDDDAESSANVAVQVTVNPVNDEQVLAVNTGTTVLEGSTGTTITALMLDTTDVDNTAAQVVYTLTGVPGNGTLYLSGSALGVSDSFTQDDLDNGRVSYDHDGSETTSDGFGFSVDDGAGVATTGTFSITVTAQNDEQVLAVNTGTTVLEGSTGTTITALMLDTTDVDNTAAQVVYTLTGVPGNGTLYLSGSALGVSDSFTQDDLDNGRVSYDHDGSETTSDGFGFSVDDGAGVATTGTFSITVTAQNDEQVLAVNTGTTVLEGSTGTTITALMLDTTDVDNTAAQVVYTLTGVPGNGTLYLSGSALGVSDSFTQDDLDNGRVSYDHDGSETTSDGFGFSVDDGAGVATTGTFSITVTAQNDEQVLAVNTGTTVLEGSTGTTITALMLDTTDVDNTAAQVVYTLTGVPGNGTLYLSGSALGVSDSFTQDDLDNGRVSYDHDGSETTSDGFGFSVDDGAGVATTGTFSITVTAQNDEQVLAVNTGTTVLEGSTGTTITALMLDTTDVDNTAAQVVYTLTGVPGNGTLYLSGSALGVSDSFTQDDLDNGRVSYDHDGSETTSDGFGFSVDDGAGVATTGTFSITVTAQNDEQVLAVNTGTTVLEGSTGTTITALMLDTTDVDNTAAQVVYTLTGVPGNGTLYLSGSALGVSDSFTQDDLDNGRVSYDHDGSETTSDGFGFSVDDGAGVATTGTFSITVTAQNDEQVLAVNTGTTVLEGSTGTTITALMLDTTDVDNTAAQVVYTLTGVPGNGTLYLSGSALGVSDSFTQDDLDNGRVSYDHDGSETTSDGFGFSVDDGAGVATTGTFSITVTAQNDEQVLAVNTGTTVLEGSTGTTITALMLDTTDVDNTAAQVVYTLTGVPGNGTLYLSGSALGVSDSFTQDDLDNGRVSYDHDGSETTSDGFGFSVDDGAGVATTGTFSITVTAQNDEQVLAVNTGTTVLEGSTGTTITALMLDTTDVDNTAAQVVYTLTGVPGNGTLYLSGSALGVSDSFTQDDLDNGRVSYDHDGSETTSDGFGFSVDDGAGVATTGTFSITVTAQNDEQVLAVNTGTTVLEGSTGTTITALMLDTTDVDNTAAQVVYTLTGVPGNGTLYLSGSALGVSDSFTQDDLDNGRVSYDHDGSETTSDGFGFSVDDGAGVATTGTFSITVTAQNDEQVLAVNTGTTVLEGSTGTTITALMLDTTDVDNTAAQVVYTLTGVPGNGTLYLSGSALGVSDSFTQDDLDNGRVSYDHDGSETTSDGFGFSVDDGAGVATTGTFSITVTAQNDEQVLAVNTGTTVLEGSTGTTITALMLDTTDVDNTAAQVVYTLTGVPGNGTLYLSGSALGVSDSFTQDDLDNGRVSYDHDGSETTSDGFGFSVDDGAGVATTGTFSITVTAQNDEQVLAVNTGTTVLEGSTGTTITALMLDTTDVDNTAAQVVYTLTGVPGNGTLYLSGSALGVSDSFTQDDLDNGRVSYDHDGSETTSDGFGFSVDDGAGVATTGTFSITVTAQNDEQVLAVNTGTTVLEGSTGTTITALMLDTTDVDNTAAQVVYTLTGVPGNGTLYLSGSALGVSDSFTQDDLDNGRVSYDHDGSETTSDGFGFSVDDGAGVATTGTFSITVTAQNDEQVLAVNTGTTVLEGSTGTTITALMLDTTDVDNTAAQVVYTLTGVPGNGTLYLSGSALGVSDSFTQDDLDNGRVSYDHDGSETTSDGFGFSVDDGAGVATTGTFDLTVNNINDAPVLGNNQMTLHGGDVVALTPAMLSAADVDNADPGLQFTVSAVAGGQFELAGASGAAISSFTQAQVIAGDVVFVDDGDSIAPAYSVAVSDGLASVGPGAATIVFNPPTVTVTTTTAPPPDPVVDPVLAPEPAPTPVIPDPVTDLPDPEPEPEPDPDPEPDEEPADEVGEEGAAGGDTDASSTGRAGGGSSVGPGIMAGFNSDSGQDGNSMQGLLKNLFVRPAALTAMAMQQSLPGGFEVDALAREVRDVLASTEFNSSLDRMREGVSDSTIFHQSVVGSGVAVTTGLSVGYVAWLVRGGVLLSTALSSLPAWQFIDPLPVLARTNEDDEDGSDDSLQSIIKEESARAANKAKETDKESGASGAAERSE